MANIRKSFNFRNGVQVDDDKLLVNSNGLVGIGTTVPTEVLDVRGTAKVVGIVTTNALYAGIATVGLLTASDANITGVLTTSQLKVGNSNVVDNLIGYAFTAWVTNDGGVGLTTLGRVGVGTTATPTEQLKVFGDVATTEGITIETGNLTVSSGDISVSGTGSINASGVITASSFSGTLDGNDIGIGTISNDRLPTNINKPTGIITASSFVGNLTGTASTATDLELTSNIAINQITSGIVTASTRASITSLGVGTETPRSDAHIVNTGISSIQITSGAAVESSITLGRSLNSTLNNGQIRFGHTNNTGSYPYSSDKSLDIINYADENLNFYLNPSGLGTAFNWLTSASNVAMTLLQNGNLGINSEAPTERLDVDGNVVASGSITGNTIVKSGGTSSQFLKADGSVDSNNYIQASNIDAPSNGITVTSDNVAGIATIAVTGDFGAGIVTSSSLSNGSQTLSFNESGGTLTLTIDGVGSVNLTLT